VEFEINLTQPHILDSLVELSNRYDDLDRMGKLDDQDGWNGFDDQDGFDDPNGLDDPDGFDDPDGPVWVVRPVHAVGPFFIFGFPNLSWTQNIIKPKINIVKIKFYLTINSNIFSKQEIEM